MSVLQGATRPGALDALSPQRCLPWGPAHRIAPRIPTAARPVETKGMRGSGSAGPQHEPPWGVAKARSDEPGGQ